MAATATLAGAELATSDRADFLLGRFPYSVIYRTLAGRVVVVAFVHLRRQPEYWRDRQ